MKQCGYCGRDNQDEATFCRECGTEFAAAIPVTKSGFEAVESDADKLVELQRCRDSESLAEIIRIVDAAGIKYQLSSLPAIPPHPFYELEKFGAGYAGDNAPQVIVSVRRTLYDQARAALESAYVEMALPEDHYILTSTDEELAEIVGKSPTWSPFEVAHARRLIAERGIDINRIDEKREEYLRQLHLGKRASRKLIFFGWIFSMLGGLFGMGIGWSLCYMKEETPDGEFFTYDEKSRVIGRLMLTLAAVVFASAILLELSVFFSH